MTEHAQAVPRLDLSSLGIHPEAERVEAILSNVMDRVRSEASTVPPWDEIRSLVRARSYLLAAAAVLAIIATASTVIAHRQQATAIDLDLIASWTATSHVPSNGELLAAYRGYRP